MANTYLTKTFGSSGSQQTATFSVWVKRSALGGGGSSLFGYAVDASNFLRIGFKSNDQLAFRNYNGGTYTWQLETNRVFRDTSAWYHIVFEVDSTQATASDRLKLYINGVQETSFLTATYPSQNANMKWGNNAYAHIIGDATGGDIFDGVMSHINVIDGTAYDASAFGQYDANGVWTIKTSPSVTYGTNGFFILKDGNSVTDQSGNGNNWTVGGGTLTNTEDCPSNVFCTINPLSIASDGSSSSTLSNGNLTITSSGTNQNSGTLASSIDSNSKWYYEFKNISGVSTTNNSSVGWSTDISAFRSGSWATYNSLFLYAADGNIYSPSGWLSAGTAPTYTNGDIIGCTVDLQNNEIKWYKNNSLAYTISSISWVGDVITPHSQWSQSGAVGSFNFGNGYFGTTAVASAGTNASGIGIFEYDVPTGYTALSTKGLNL